MFDEVASSGKAPETIIREKGLVQITDAKAITEVVKRVLTEHPKEVSAYRGGKTKVFGFFVGQVMKATGGNANPKTVNEILKGMLQG